MKNGLLVYLLLMCSLQSFSQVNLNAGLVAYYPFNGNANDASGNGNNPIFNNATPTSDRFGNPNSAYSFNGTDNYIRIPNSSSLNSSNQISICAWVKVEGFYQGTCHGNNVVMKGNADYQTGNYKIRFDDSYFTNGQNCSSSNPDVNHETFFGLNSSPSSTAPFIQTGQWYSVVYTCDGVTAKTYVNCELTGSGPANGITFTNSDDLFLGSLDNAQFPYWFNGVMDEVRIYNRPINEDEIKAYGDCSTATSSCNNWLSTPSRYSYVDIGKLDVPGHTITVEAVINRTQPYVSGTGDNIEGDVVSKHDNPNDINYLLRPNHAAITTSKGYFVTPDIQDIDLNKTYHIAMVYDGSTLKFYRNGCLMSQVAATGDLYQNGWDTRIGYYQNQIWNTNFIGYINEVRIWNVARTQGQIRTYMNTSLPNPASQSGLLAYYTFDNLINKQGNASWNGTLGGSASINTANPSCNPIDNLCNSSCSNWLKTPSTPSSVRIGQLNIPGHQVTVEAEINRTAPYSGGQVWAGDVVSKHRDPTDANYLLRPNSGEITTTTGYYKTPDIADIQLNETYHIAMVYDGDSLKFYRNGCLMSEIKATGDLIQNSWETSIGYYSPEMYPNENFIGYINEVRIWNVARTQAQLQAYMNSSLPNPTSQSGLLAYYTFDNLINKQGNPSWNGTINGSASINETNPSCNPIVNACKIACNMSITKSADTTVCEGSSFSLFAKGGSTYSWTPAATLDNPASATPIASPTKTTTYFVKVDDGSGCSKTDSVKVTVQNLPVISKSNDTSICVNSAAQLSASGGSSYSWTPVASLDQPASATPIARPAISTKYFVTVTDNSGCSNKDSVNVTVNGLPVVSKSNDTSICKNSSVQLSASGGSSYSWTPTSSLNNPTIANPVAAPSASTKYYVTVTNANGCSKADSIQVSVKSLPVVSKSNDTTICANSSAKLNASGGTSYSWTPATSLDDAGSPSPVASPLVSTKYYVTVTDNSGCSKKDSINILVDNLPAVSTSNDTSICENTSVALFSSGGTSYSWTPANTLDDAAIATPLATPLISTTYFVTVTDSQGCSKKDSVEIAVNSLPVISKSNDTTICNNSSVKLIASGGTSYSWAPAGSLNDANISNPVASPVAPTTYFITVSNGGCSALDSVHVGVYPVANIQTSNDTTVCNNSSTKIFATGGTSYSWTPASLLDDATISSPFASPPSTTVFHVTITDSYSCVYKDSVKLSVRALPAFSVSPDNSICSKSSQQLNASGGDSYIWIPASYLDNSKISNPIASPDSSITYTVIISDTTCKQTDTLFTKVTVLPSPNVVATHANDIDCSFGSSKLNATGGTTYTWSPADGLDNFGIANPVASPTATTVYTVTGKGQNGCSNFDTVTVKVNFNRGTVYGLANSFTPNGDGLNDCFGVKDWGQVSQLDLRIYNRFGQLVFQTNNPQSCWDGTFKGNPQQADVFVYTIKAKAACGNIDKKGTVTLVR